MKWVKIERNIYPVTVYFFCGGDVDEVSEQLADMGLEPLEDCEKMFGGEEIGWTLQMYDDQNRFVVVVWVKSCRKNPEDVSLLSHECLHVTYAVFKHISLSKGAVMYEDQELHCYYQDFLVRKALEAFWA